MVLEKCRERVAMWKCFEGKGDIVAGLMSRIVRLEKQHSLSIPERTVLTQFLICAFSGLEVDAVRQVGQFASSSVTYTHILSFLTCLDGRTECVEVSVTAGVADGEPWPS
jgi:hypothetical protein